MAVTKKVYYEIPLSIGLAGLISGRFTKTDIVNTADMGFESLYIQLRFKTGAGSINDTPYLSLFYIESHDADGNLKSYREMGIVAVEEDTVYTTGVWISNVTPYWGVGILNNSGIDLDDDPTEVTLVAVGLLTQEVDQFFFSYSPSGGFLAVGGDAEEISFPYVYLPEGSLVVSGSVPLPQVTALGIFRISGTADVETPLDYAAGRVGRLTGTASGPSASP